MTESSGSGSASGWGSGLGRRIRVLIVDDHSLVRAGFQSILSLEDDIEVVGEAKDGKGPVKWVKLMESSKESWRPQGPFVFSPTQRARDMTVGPDRGPFVLEMPGKAWFDVNMQQKDMKLALELGRQVDVPLPTTAIANEFLTAARAVGYGDYDFAVLFHTLAKMAGVEASPARA